MGVEHADAWQFRDKGLIGLDCSTIFVKK
jgi:hypothetical protein